MEKINELIENFNYLYEEISNENYEAEDKVADLEEKIDQLIEDYFYQDDYHFKGEPKELDALKKLKNDIKKIKREFNFYDKQAELDRMFQSHHDEDFDEDDMGFRSIIVYD